MFTQRENYERLLADSEDRLAKVQLSFSLFLPLQLVATILTGNILLEYVLLLHFLSTESWRVQDVLGTARRKARGERRLSKSLL